MIDKIKLEGIPFVDGVPDPENVPGQSRLDWLKNNECMSGSATKTGNEGSLNRTGVAIQKNIEVLESRDDVIAETVNDIIEIVDKHSAILDQSDDLDLIETVKNHTDILDTHATAIEDLQISETNTIDAVNLINDRLGPQTEGTVFEELKTVKEEVGSYPGFDLDGNPNLDSEGSGLKLRVINNTEAIGKNDSRIIELERNWHDSDLGTLTENVKDLRYEMGPIGAVVPGKPVYSRLEVVEKKAVTQEDEIQKLNIHTGIDSFPRDGFDTLDLLVQDLEDNAASANKAISEQEFRITDIEDEIGNKNIEDSIIGQQVQIKSDVNKLQTIVGETSSDGMRLQVATLTNEVGTDSTRGTLKYRTSQSEHNIRDLNIRIDEINENIDGSGSIGSRFDVLERDMNGDPVGADAFDKKGVKAASKELFNKNLISDAIDAKFYVRSKNTWKELGSFDFDIGTSSIVSSNNNLMSVVENIGLVINEGGTLPVVIEGKIENVNTDQVQIDGKKALSFNNGVVLGDSSNTLDIVATEVRVNGEVLGQGNVKDVTLDGQYIRKVGQWIKTDFENIQIKGLSVGDKVILSTGATISLGNKDSKLSLVNLTDVDSKGLDIKESGYSMMKFGQSEITFGRDLKVGSDKVWTDKIDAPKDGEYYARRQGAWEKIDPTGSGTGTGLNEAPTDGKLYARVDADWKEVGSKDINQADSTGVRWETNTPMNFTGINYAQDTDVLTVGGSGVKLDFLGKVQDIVLDENASIKQMFGSVSTNIIRKDSDDNISIGDTPVKTLILKSRDGLKYQDADGLKDVWHSGMDAPADNKMYGRIDNEWKPFAINSNVDIQLDYGFAYKIKDTNDKVMNVARSGSENLIELGQTGTLMNIRSTLRSLVLDNKVSIQSKSESGDNISLLTLSDKLSLGNSAFDLDISAKSAQINGSKIWTDAFDAPKNDVKYSRLNGEWSSVYEYGAGAPNSVGAKEGDVYFQFM
ncbi:MAG: hypothetical protein [Caudoviricetes sp.]|nr:MAG: hypothetical protein [Caudoviricetes sp.]